MMLDETDFAPAVADSDLDEGDTCPECGATDSEYHQWDCSYKPDCEEI